jgi:phosphoglycerate kinase
LDIGPKTIKDFTETIHEAGTVIWNGPMGKFEMEPFRHGTQGIVQALCATQARTLVGGGESVQALERFGDAKAIDHVSTGGGAFLMYLKDRKLPALDVILQRQPQPEHAS